MTVMPKTMHVLTTGRVNPGLDPKEAVHFDGKTVHLESDSTAECLRPFPRDEEPT
jgi:hypothetical protein